MAPKPAPPRCQGCGQVFGERLAESRITPGYCWVCAGLSARARYELRKALEAFPVTPGDD